MFQLEYVPSIAQELSRVIFKLKGKRKMEDEGRLFDYEWNTKYFFTQSTGKSIYSICQNSIAAMKEDISRQHYEAVTDELGKSKLGLMSFEESENAEKAVDNLNGKELDGCAQKKSKRASELMKMEHQGVNLYIKNLDKAIDDERLQKEFAPFGKITSAKVMTNDYGRSKGFGFVCFSSPEEAFKAITEMNGKILVSKSLYVGLAQRKEDRKVQLALERMAGMPIQHSQIINPGSAGSFIPTMPAAQRSYLPQMAQMCTTPGWSAHRQMRPSAQPAAGISSKKYHPTSDGEPTSSSHENLVKKEISKREFYNKRHNKSSSLLATHENFDVFEENTALKSSGVNSSNLDDGDDFQHSKISNISSSLLLKYESDESVNKYSKIISPTSMEKKNLKLTTASKIIVYDKNDKTASSLKDFVSPQFMSFSTENKDKSEWDKTKSTEPLNMNLQLEKETNQNSPNKNTKRKQRSKIHLKTKEPEPDMSNIVPLLSFQRLNAEPEEYFQSLEFSDEDDSFVASQFSDYSGVENVNVTDFSDDENFNNISKFSASSLPNETFNLTDLSNDCFTIVPEHEHFDENSASLSFSDDSDSTNESEVKSELSISSSIMDTASNFINFNRGINNKEAFVSVFWDIETCILPYEKSVVDFTNYIRDIFYEGRTEDEFVAACDVSRLNDATLKELDEASVMLMHICSRNKYSDDKSLQSFLQRFQSRHQMSHSAVVLISSNSDVTQFLLDMQYQHCIDINLIYGASTKQSLIAAANKSVQFEDVLEKLPDRLATDNMQYILSVSNLPEMNPKVIKICLSEKLKNFTYKIKFVNNASSVEIIFQDRSVCNKAMTCLKGYYLGGNAISYIYKERLNEDVNTVPKKKSRKEKLILQYDLLSGDSSNYLLDSQKEKKSSWDKGATLTIIVGIFLDDIAYWKTSLEKKLKTSDFTLQWEGHNFDGYLLIHFNNLKKAHKAKKILLKNQINDPNAPKFLKLVESEYLLNFTMDINNSIEEINKKKIVEHVEILEKKTENLLMNHQNIIEKIMLESMSEVQGASEAVKDKLDECNEQMETFKNFSEHTIESIKNLSNNSEIIEQTLNELLCDFIRECNCFSSALPIYAKKDLILRKIKEHQVIIILAETGSGKSTQISQYIWRERNSFKNGKVICTQPRKIAAVSLAKHVSSQIGSNLGDIVGYQVGVSKKTSLYTGILYVTDFTMLKMIVSENLNDISCLIIDEAHERTIYTDILLGMIKSLLPFYPHLKVVITSATIDTSIFRDYFNLTDASVLHISGRAFPVEDIWLNQDVSPGWDYFSNTINTALAILTEEPGDILSFLTTPLETEKAAESFYEKLTVADRKKVKVFNLHGKLNVQEQQKVFEKTSEGMRKVVFATNCAETSITIPGIRYVVDCGMVKESQYDARRNMNVLSTGFVSKSSSEQRRGRAGRTQIGKCYHLYSQTNYAQMAVNTKPEILRINLGQALLKLMKMGISDPIQFDFVQSPPKDLLISTMKQLLYLKAVDENNLLLTDLGSKMAVLPLEPRLCHLIFQGILNDVGYEALAAAALITSSNTIFYRNSENKEIADKKKARFCEFENDFLTYLEVYKEWLDVPKRLKSHWCITNCINGRSMKIVHELINEMILILQNELSIKVQTKFENYTYDTLIKVIFHSFSENLSVYSGHFKFGYKSLNISDKLVIHPASSLCAFERSTPRFVVYDTILKTTQNFMVNICPVTRDLILETISMHGLSLNLKAFESLIASEFCRYPLGEKTIVNNFIGKKGIKHKDLVKKIKELIHSDSVEIDINVPKGSIKIVGYGSEFNKIESIVSPIINEARQKVYKEERDIRLLKDIHTSKFTAILVAGGVFKDVILPGEFRDIKVKLKGSEDINYVRQKLLVCGSITEIREWKKYFKVTFEIPAFAEKALEMYKNETEFSLQSIQTNGYTYRDYLYRVYISFLRRKCTGLAFISLDEDSIDNFLRQHAICYRGSLCTVTRSRNSNDIRIHNLPVDTDKKHFESYISSLLPIGNKITKCVIVRQKPYESIKAEVDLIKKNVLDLFSQFTFKEDIEVVLREPSSNDFVWNATAYFKNPLDGENAVNVLKGRKNITNFVGGLMLKPFLQTFIHCKSEIFSAVKDEIERALNFFKEDLSVGSSLDIKAIPKLMDKVEIKITSNNVSDIFDAQRSIHTILNGDKIELSKSSDKEKLFTDLGKEFIKKLSMVHQDCYILQNVYSKTITLFGKVDACNIVKMKINLFLKELENEEYKDITLKAESGKSVLKELFKNYGYDLMKLKDECNASDVQAYKYKQILTIQGNSFSVTKCESILQNLKKKLDADCTETFDEMCPVCCDEVSNEKHRLEYCGHAYCTECLLHLFQNSENTPLLCEHSSKDVVCKAPIVVVDIFWAINGRKPLEKVLYEKFLRSFVESRSDINYCPSPGCPMIFRSSEEKMNAFRCPACSNDICTQCKEIYHYGITCSIYQCFKSNTDSSLRVWMQEDFENRKQCPSCSSPIEKNGGCDHMTCWKCKCHMCWLCLQVFSDSRQVLEHLSYCPNILN